MRERHSEDRLHILIPKTNSNNFTYDGIDLGAERVTHEIETYIEDLREAGKHVKRFSIVGYSLGGLVARYVIGLLYSRKCFDNIEPTNFTTFATPHLGVRTPVLGVGSRIWNFLGSSTLSISGRQLFLMDTFRDTGKSLISVLADPDTTFMRALQAFPRRVLYANIVNDRSAPYYTTSISFTDPFRNLDVIDINYLPDYSPNILDPVQPLRRNHHDVERSLLSRLATSTMLSQIPLFALLGVILPIGSVVFLINSGIQSVRSRQRIRLHEEGKAGIGLGAYRIPFMVEDARGAVEEAIENVNSNAPESKETSIHPHTNDYAKEHLPHSPFSSLDSQSKAPNQIEGFPKLELTPEQFSMIKELDGVGFKKYRVHIHQVRHSHAAIVVRTGRKGFAEGKVVIRHWLENEFQI